MEDGDIALEIFDVLVKHMSTRKSVAEALVNKFENSKDFQNAKDNMALLEKVRYLDTSLIHRLRTAAKRNRQIAEAWGVSDRLKKLISRLEE